MTTDTSLFALWADLSAELQAHGDGAPWPDERAAAWQRRLQACTEAPASADQNLWRLALAGSLPLRDVLLLSLALWPEDGAVDALDLRQALRLLDALRVRGARSLPALAGSPLFARGWLLPALPGAPLAVQALRLPPLLALALLGRGDAAGPLPRLPAAWQPVRASLPLVPGWAALARQAAAALATAADGRRPRALVLRHDERSEAHAWLAAVAAALGHRLLVRDEAAPQADDANLPASALPPWLWLTHSLPLFDALQLDAPHFALPAWPGHGAPLLVLAPPGLAVHSTDRDLVEWRLPLPGAAERAVLWAWALDGDAADAPLQSEHRQLAERHRLGPAAIRAAALAGAGAPGAALPPPAAAFGLQGLGRWLVPGRVTPVLPVPVRAELALLRARCLQREALPAQLAPTAAARHGSGVRALLHGLSGTGKTLAAEWLAAQLGKPMLVVDTAAVTSKYIGETERNLERVMGAAERADAVLLFDEADALFARRTEVGNANDRHANAQTNYLLQRLESHGGITVLTSNSRSRIDAAFTRRLDAVIEFTLPTPPERLALWRALLGQAAAGLAPAFLERLALEVEASGGTLRNIVATATVLAGTAPDEAALAVATALECAKTGTPAPAWAGQAHAQWLQRGAPLGTQAEPAVHG
jgi:predicted nucleic acid-binding protein